jgi:hypothetical protein
MGTQSDWIKVLFLAVFWAIGMSLWAYIRRRRRHDSGQRDFSLGARFGAYAIIALLSLDFGLLTTFWAHAFHGSLLFVLLGTNIALAVVVVAFCLSRPVKTS